jgi:hypothetical protein
MEAVVLRVVQLFLQLVLSSGRNFARDRKKSEATLSGIKEVVHI